MRHTDPLETWLASRSMVERLGELPEGFLDRILKLLRQPLESVNRELLETGLAAARLVVPGTLPAEDVSRAEALYRHVYAAGGSGTSYAQAGLLSLLGASCQERSIPFWMELLDLARPRDRFNRRRRTFALAALAYMAITNRTRGPEEALHQATAHGNPEVRAEAISYWVQVYKLTRRKLPRKVTAALQAIAMEDAAFAPRFQARAALREAKHPVPLDNPGGIYAFKVKFKGVKSFYRTIELRTEQTLDHLHRAIQHALGWDSDHLYSFFMNGEPWDERYSFACPYEDDNPPWTDEAVLGDLGLVERHQFLYLFDYGDSHQFEVEVVGMRPADQVERGRYPRVVDSHGEAPEQYPRYE